MLGSSKGRRLVELMPVDRVLTETDAPFAQLRGKPLMPWDVQLAYAHLAKIWGLSEPEVVIRLRENLKALLKH
jgi:TatD DNase family protein